MAIKTHTGKWYESYKVPATTSNKSLGLVDIRLYPATTAQEAHDIVCTAIVKLVCGSVRCTIRESQNQKGLLNLFVPGVDKVVDTSTGEIRYYENVILDIRLKAQILKYVETQIEEE